MVFVNNFSSIVEPFLYLGGSFFNNNPFLAPAFGFTHVLNIANEIKPNPLLFFALQEYKHIPADDSYNYNIRVHFEEAFKMIDDALKSNGKILIHCAMGISRSATIVIAYLMSRYKLSFNSAFNYVKNRRPEINPNWYFLNLLIDYEHELKGNYIRSQKITKERRPVFTFIPDKKTKGIYPSYPIWNYNNMKSIRSSCVFDNNSQMMKCY